MSTAPASIPAAPLDVVHRRLPPVAQLAMASMALIVAGGIDLAAHLPARAALGPPAALVAAAAALYLAGLVTVSRIRPFAWPVFFRVGGWSSLAYLVISGMLEFVFVFDHTRGSMLLLMTLSLLVFTLDIPLLLAFSVARYQPVERPTA